MNCNFEDRRLSSVSVKVATLFEKCERIIREKQEGCKEWSECDVWEADWPNEGRHGHELREAPESPEIDSVHMGLDLCCCSDKPVCKRTFRECRRDIVLITVGMEEEMLLEDTKYNLVLAQPAPVDGFNLPVYIKTKNGPPIPLFWSGVGDAEFGGMLPRGCHRRIVPIFLTNSGHYTDLRCRDFRFK